ncbi:MULTISPECIES: type I-E CRISPR-associated protein Cas6/Cse3/CasE [unclassified Saccharopolyspora]|uniref:type I-E CRISPR-associated protein Cas6/Cse3/CasE n=1 Tax=unclassified Saccharopolyspora TaxID=2646250 RepID=UPI001CD6549A|nr:MULTISPECIES: type I-E CRISPR-associated protein Cas6/Cse3/CasE [unclassified Saccharopolyspora]MCA1188776.1 type I-E CRISPR-associated protein Cas6/Cse3/CasE [Saccharopolyspora sp. 6T]MCA1283268.1 type I-E CRISPR-associated protein Cas6/Cse3/CasE [Saccharopolyspora sp. 7B]
MTNTLNGNTTLTRLRLNSRHRAVGEDLADATRMHRRVMSLMPDSLGEQARAHAGVLYRVEKHLTGSSVLLQTGYQPDFTALPTDYAERSTHQLDGMLANITTGITVRYRILANPTRVETTDTKRKTRRWLRGDDALSWWKRRAQQAGLEPHTALLTNEELITATRENNDGAHRISHGTSLFEGTATVTDPDAVRHAVLSGIGKARAFGCGLLSLAPTNRS